MKIRLRLNWFMLIRMHSGIQPLRRQCDFEKKYPNIKVNYEVNYEDKVYEDILIKKIARNELGDIVQLKTRSLMPRVIHWEKYQMR